MAVEERGLANPNPKIDADALEVLKEPYIEELFDKLGVLSPVEPASPFEIFGGQYILAIEVEAKLVVSMAKTGINSATVKYLSELFSTITSLIKVCIEAG